MHFVGTVEGEMDVASFLVNFFNRLHFQTFVAVHPCPVCTPNVPLLIVTAERNKFLLKLTNTRSGGFLALNICLFYASCSSLRVSYTV